MPARALPGFRDFYPEDAALRAKIFAAWRNVAATYGFEEYDGPPLEPLELYTEKSGDEIVEQLYHFVDKGGREVALRPEMTPTLARMVATRASSLKKPIRWFSVGQLFRYERKQRGRLREHFQLNMDIIGEASPLADAEVIAAALDVPRALGFGPEDVRVHVSDRRVIRHLLVAGGTAEDKIGAALAVIDKVHRETRSALMVALEKTGISGQVAERVLTIGEIRGDEALKNALAEVKDAQECASDLFECLEALDHAGLASFVEVDCGVVRGLAYYTGIVFEVFDAQRSLRAICGGGRYDGLLRDLGGADLPAVGFGMGDVVLAELMKSRATSDATAAGLDAFLVAVTAEDVPTILELAHDLRDQGVRVEYALKQQGVTKQLRLATARSARRAVVIGPDERKKAEAVVRDLSTGSEERVAIEKLLDGYAWS